MAKGYWIVGVNIHDSDAYQAYVRANGPVFAKFGARFLIRAGSHVVVEGKGCERNVVIEFPSYETAVACWKSPAYQNVMKLRVPHSEANLVIIEGYDGPQPT